MYGFPEKLFPTPQRMFFDENMFYGFPQKRAIFYSVKNGNWSDRTIWRTVGNAGVNGVPGNNDTVYIRHNVTADLANAYCYNLFVSGYLILPNLNIIWVKGIVKSVGQVGVINNADLSNKSNTGLAGNLNPITTTIDLKDYGIIVGGFTLVNNIASGILVKNMEGGRILFQRVEVYGPGNLSISTNTQIEFRGGIKSNSAPNFGSGGAYFSTNNQSLEGGPNLTFGDIIIRDIVLTIESTGIISTNSISGISAASSLINKGILNLKTPTLPMIVGSFDYLTYPNQIGYVFDGNYTLPYTSYYGLRIGGTGTKKFSGATSFLGDLYIVGTLDIENYGLTIPGTTIVDNGGSFTRSGTGNTILIGQFLVRGAVSFGSNSIELRGGISGYSSSSVTINNDIILSTNNQNIDATTANIPASITFNGSLLIRGAIIITAGNHLPTFSVMTFIKQINGDNAGSTFVNKLNSSSRFLSYQAASQPMATGILDCNSYANVFKYNLNGDQEVKGTTYRTLEFGNSGVKKLMGNVVINISAGGSWSITGTATIDYNGYTITTI